MTVVSTNTIADAVGAHAPAYGISRAYLFGSYARGDADADSDIDICIEPEKGFTLFALGGFAQRLEGDLGLHVDVVCGEESFYPRAYARFQKDKVLVYEKS